MKKLLIYSDLHLEFADFQPRKKVIDEADLVILAGDIAPGTAGVLWAQKVFAGKPVLYTIGNHELYEGNVSRTSIEIKKAAEGSNVIVLDSDAVVIDGIRFLGTTLWTDFRLYGDSPAIVQKALHAARNCMADFSCITHGTTGWMTPEQSVGLHEVAKAWLLKELSKPNEGMPTVVITHHGPARGSVAPQWARDPISPAFVSRCEEIPLRASLHIHGHTHWFFDYRVGDDPAKGRVVCNPRGYQRRNGLRGEVTGFRPDFMVIL